MESQITTKSLSILKKNLPENGMEEISLRLNMSLSTVSRVMNGKTIKRQTDVVEAALSLIEENSDRINSLNQKIKELKK
ncbi:hypothetical protein ACR79B_11025 [Sphingobacterium spiritivorum]|uniref:hypothetical protein n=1 Tax=Sphingobacterium spiritivorum TaxID=258 RepID=UPI003DA2467A